MRSSRARLTTLALGAVLAVGAGGCTQLRSHQGYIVDQALVDSVAVGIDNKASVERTLGRPTFSGQFNDNDWYYLSRNTRQLAFADPSATDQLLLKVSFDRAGNVAALSHTGREAIVKLRPNGHKTPTLGRNRSFFEDIFGNIGTVGAPGVGGPQGGAGAPGG